METINDNIKKLNDSFRQTRENHVDLFRIEDFKSEYGENEVNDIINS